MILVQINYTEIVSPQHDFSTVIIFVIGLHKCSVKFLKLITNKFFIKLKA